MREFKIDRRVKWNWSSRGSTVAKVDSSEDISGAAERPSRTGGRPISEDEYRNREMEVDRYCKIVDSDDVQLATIPIPRIEQNKGAERLRIGRFLIRERIQDPQDGATNLLTRTIV
jgi:hypothetical protein